MKKLLLIDANSIIHRCFHALPPLTAPDGRPTQSLYGIASMLLKLFKEGAPDFAAAAFDRPEPTFRKEKYAAYKAQRPKAPDELISQIIEAHELFATFGIRTFEKPGFEADDIIATLATKFSKQKDCSVVILTGDLDTLQLVCGTNVVVRTFRKGISDTFTYDENAVMERYGLSPLQIVDYKALVGDASDNIKGIPGVGPKTASALLQKYGTLERLAKHFADEPKFAVKVGSKDSLTFSKFLVTLKTDVPLEIEDIASIAFHETPPERLIPYFSKMGFETLIARVSPSLSAVKKEATKKRIPQTSSGQLSFFGKPNENTAETSSIMILNDAEDDARGERLSSRELKVGFDIKERMKEVWKKRLEVASPYWDLGIAFWLLDPDLKAYDPQTVSRIFLKKEWNGTREEYRSLYAYSRNELEEKAMLTLFETLEMPLVEILAEMEVWGIGISKRKLHSMQKTLEVRVRKIEEAIFSLVGEKFNINSPKQVGEMLYDKLALASSKRHSNRSTSAERLAELKGAHPVIEHILEYRELFKLLSTYVIPLQSLCDGDGRLRTSFVQTGTGTGRLSSESPNLQNIPHEVHREYDIRRAFEAEKGWEFLSFDYSQLELRILAALSNDTEMTGSFLRGEDIHALTASKVFGKPAADVTSEDRRIAKALNFGLVYGMGSSAYAATAGISKTQAKEFIRAYFSKFSGVGEWQEKIKQEARRTGFTETLTGRRRYFPGIRSPQEYIAKDAERAALNHPIQGLEADIIKKAMLETRSILKGKGWWGEKVRLVLSLHDELLLEVRDDIIEEAARLVRDAVQNVIPSFPIPLIVETKRGVTWGEMRKLF